MQAEMPQKEGKKVTRSGKWMIATQENHDKSKKAAKEKLLADCERNRMEKHFNPLPEAVRLEILCEEMAEQPSVRAAASSPITEHRPISPMIEATPFSGKSYSLFKSEFLGVPDSSSSRPITPTSSRSSRSASPLLVPSTRSPSPDIINPTIDEFSFQFHLSTGTYPSHFVKQELENLEQLSEERRKFSASINSDPVYKPPEELSGNEVRYRSSETDSESSSHITNHFVSDSKENNVYSSTSNSSSQRVESNSVSVSSERPETRGLLGALCVIC